MLKDTVHAVLYSSRALLRLHERVKGHSTHFKLYLLFECILLRLPNTELGSNLGVIAAL